jgi:hypothetical protein
MGNYCGIQDGQTAAKGDTIERLSEDWYEIDSQVDPLVFAQSHSESFFANLPAVQASLRKRPAENLLANESFRKYEGVPFKRLVSTRGKYEGQTRDRMRHGAGHFQNPHGDFFVGFFDCDVASGPATIYYQNGDIFLGELKDGHRTFGSLLFSNGEVYEGQFNELGYHGKGKYSFPDGRVYDGFYKDNNKFGQGSFTWPNGAKYDGQWDKVQHGYGVFTDEFGAVTKGMFFEGQKVKN